MTHGVNLLEAGLLRHCPVLAIVTVTFSAQRFVVLEVAPRTRLVGLIIEFRDTLSSAVYQYWVPRVYLSETLERLATLFELVRGVLQEVSSFSATPLH